MHIQNDMIKMRTEKIRDRLEKLKKERFSKDYTLKKIISHGMQRTKPSSGFLKKRKPC